MSKMQKLRDAVKTIRNLKLYHEVNHLLMSADDNAGNDDATTYESLLCLLSANDAEPRAVAWFASQGVQW